MTRTSTSEYVVVTTVPGQFMEEQVRAFLAAHGIATHVRGEALRVTHGITLDGLGAVDILVASADAACARELLMHADRGDFALGDEQESEPQT
jgi:hypothetical protein